MCGLSLQYHMERRFWNMSLVHLKVPEKALIPFCFRESEAASVGSMWAFLAWSQAWGADYSQPGGVGKGRGVGLLLVPGVSCALSADDGWFSSFSPRVGWKCVNGSGGPWKLEGWEGGGDGDQPVVKQERPEQPLSLLGLAKITENGWWHGLTQW